MPKLSQIRTTALRDLAEQLRFAPRATLWRQIERTRELVEELDPDSTYEESWVVRRITGYRPAIDEPVILVGAALLADLSSLIERLCASARLTLGQIEEPTLTLDELSERWGVSRRTVERYRRRGLVALRVVDEDGQARIVIPSEVVEQFERSSAELLERARRFARAGPASRAQIIRDGEDLQRDEGLSASAAASRLAPVHGRSREAIRQVLLKAPSFEKGDAGLSAGDRRALLRAWRMGVAPVELADRFSVPRSSVHRVVREQRAIQLRSLELVFAVKATSQSESETDASLLEDPALREGLSRAVVLDARELVQASEGDGPIPEPLERALTGGHRLLLGRAARGITSLSRADPSSSLLDAIETDLRWAALVKIRIVELVRGLMVRAVEDRLGGSLLESTPGEMARVHKACVGAICAAVDRFDSTRGGRLAAPVSLSLNRTLARLELGDIRGAAGRAQARSIPLEDWTGSVAPWQAWLELDPGATERAGELETGARDLLSLRFGLQGRRPYTLRETAAILGIGPRRAGRIEREALVRAYSR